MNQFDILPWPVYVDPSGRIAKVRKIDETIEARHTESSSTLGVPGAVGPRAPTRTPDRLEPGDILVQYQEYDALIVVNEAYFAHMRPYLGYKLDELVQKFEGDDFITQAYRNLAFNIAYTKELNKIEALEKLLESYESLQGS